MTHFGVIVPPVPGHLNPMAGLSRELKRRGHRITVLHIPDLEQKIRAEGLEFCPIGYSTFPPGSFAVTLAQLGKQDGLAGMKFIVEEIRRTTEMICQDAPAAVRSAGIEALLVDQTEPAGSTVAEYLKLPFFSISCALTINREPAIPPIFTDWSYTDTWWGRLRNQCGYYLFDRLTQPINAVLTHYRHQWNLPPYRSVNDSFSPLAQISQQPAEFDFPRNQLPSTFYYTGPFRTASPSEVSFPYERLTGQPIIYASLGTQQNRRKAMFEQIAAACVGLDAQLVITHCNGGLSETEVQKFPGSPLVVPFAPQFELLSRAALVITHAGLNTVLDALSHGVPMVAIPITYEQPAIAARLAAIKAGAIIPLKRFNAQRLRTSVERVLADDTYRHNAQRLKQAIQTAGGAVRAADVIESKLGRTSSGSSNISSQPISMTQYGQH